jgi:3-deoxy-D-manno-octulosonic-acid transferase
MPREVRGLSVIERLALWAYGWVMRALVPLLRRKLRRRGRAEPGYVAHIEQRLGHYPGMPASSGWLWVHAVSLGETRAAGLLLKALRARMPGLRVLLTHGTATGRAEGAKWLAPGDVQVWQPWDTPQAIHRFLDHFQPALGVLMETEVWPHWVQACRARGVRLCLVNGRLSDKTLQRARRMAWLARPAYAGLHAVLAQTPADAQRFAQLGATVHGVLGNLKFDVAPDQALMARGRRWRQAAGNRPVVMLASSRDGEEALWLQALRQVPGASGVLWLLVPRHPQRFDAVATLLAQAGLTVFRRSAWADDADPPSEAATASVWLGDSLGEMHAYYAMADVAWLGGSFLPLGGQNLIEAAACGCPVVMGPHTFNFADAAEQAIQVGAAFRVPDMAAAMPRTQRLLHDASALAAARQACERLLQQGQGAAQRYAAFLLDAYRHGAEEGT